MSFQGAKYQQIVEWIRRKIEDGTLQQGTRLMSENEMCLQFDASRQTVRHATGLLEEEGLLKRVRGSGTYVAKQQNKESAVIPAKRERFHRIAVISTFYESYIFPPTLKGIENILTPNGYIMQVAFTDNRISRETDILKNLLEQDNIDGLIVEPSKSALPNPNLYYYKKIQKRGIPILCFNAEYPGLDVPCVRLDDKKIVKKAVEYLHQCGHDNIAAIFKSDDRQGSLRYEGYLNGIIEAGLHTSQKQVLWIDTPMTQNLALLADYVFSRIEGSTAVICYNDQVAYQLVNMAHQKGIRVPEDLSVMGMDDSYLAEVSRTPITSYPHPKGMLGEKAAENMLKMIEDSGYDGNYLYDSDVIERDSVSIKF